MRPEKFRNELNKTIEKYLKKRDASIFKPLLKELKRKYNKLNKMDDDPDLRTGEETYGYEDVWDRMEYISDRWNCSFRIRWLIDGIENNKF